MHDELHWLDVPARVRYKLCTLVRRCLKYYTSVPDGALCTFVCHRSTATSSLGCQSSADSAVTPTQHERSSDLRCRRSHCVELAAETFARPLPQHFCFWMFAHNTSFSQSTSVFSSLEALGLAMMRYIDLRFTLHCIQ